VEGRGGEGFGWADCVKVWEVVRCMIDTMQPRHAVLRRRNQDGGHDDSEERILDHFGVLRRLVRGERQVIIDWQ